MECLKIYFPYIYELIAEQRRSIVVEIFLENCSENQLNKQINKNQITSNQTTLSIIIHPLTV